MRALLLSLAGISSAFAADRPRSTPRDQLPREVARVVSVNWQLVENQLRTQLDGRTEGHLILEAQLETREKFHVYADRLNFWTEADPRLDGNEWKLEILSRPPTTRFFDPVSKGLKEGFQGQLVFRVKLALPAPIPAPLPADHALKLVTYFQACSDKVCLLPVASRTDLPLAGAAPVRESRGFLERASQAFRTQLASDDGLSIASVALILVAGLLTAFTPCVYPLYPVTLGIFSRWSRHRHANPLFLSLSYCAGLTASYAALGLVSAFSGSVFGSLTQTPGFLILVGLVILVSALFFSGLFTFPMPRALMNFFTRAEDASVIEHSSPATLAGKAALMGAGLGVVASPCVGPVLVAILAWLGTSTASVGTGVLMLALFGAGMSLPFLALGVMIVRLGKRPTLGPYTPYIKHAGTVLMAGASLFFLVPGVQLLRAQGAGAPAAVATYPVARLEDWKRDRWTVIDFRADWCAACHDLESKTFASREIAPRFETNEWEMVRVDLTKTGETETRIAREYRVVSLPTILIAAPGGKICAKETLYGFEDATAFGMRLARAKADCR